MTVELLTLTPDPGLAEEFGGRAAPALVRLFGRHGVKVRGRRVVSVEDGEAERALRQAIEAGGLVVCLGEGEGADAARQALARVLGVRLVLSDSALDALAIGSYLVTPFLDRRRRWLTILAVLELAIGIAAVLSFGPLAQMGPLGVARRTDDRPVAVKGKGLTHRIPMLRLARYET